MTVAGFESQKRSAPSGPGSSRKAGGWRRYAPKRLAASAKRASAVESELRRSTTYFWYSSGDSVAGSE